ncbi:MAG: hypothetical protein M3290_03320 [Actinomycetota bacterium]|nr:hypothetical protein [Actinomycetota bacterium]
MTDHPEPVRPETTPPPPPPSDGSPEQRRRLSRVVLAALATVILVVIAAVVIGGRGDRPEPLPTDLPRTTFSVPGRFRTGTPSDLSEVLVRLRAYDKTCWTGNINDKPVKGCGGLEWQVRGKPGVGGVYSATIQKTTSDRSPIVLELVVNGDLVNSAETRKPLGTIAVTGR